MSEILAVRNLKKYFATPKGMLHAVDGVSFGIEEGKTIGIVGESGCGKSTLGRVILHLLDPTDGEIHYEGSDITKLKKSELKGIRKNMQMIFQDPYSSLNPRMTVSEAIAEPLIRYNVFSRKNELNDRVSQLMDTVGLAQRLYNT